MASQVAIFSVIVSKTCKNFVGWLRQWGQTPMAIGVVISAIVGGMVAMLIMVGADAGLSSVLISYPIGGILCIFGFFAIRLRRKRAEPLSEP
jgi:hypothetical protein